MNKILHVDDRNRGHPLDRVKVERSMRGGICSRDIRVAQVALERKGVAYSVFNIRHSGENVSRGAVGIL